MSTWTEPFGFTKEEGVLDLDADTEVVVLVSTLALDLVTLPLALLRVIGVSEGDSE